MRLRFWKKPIPVGSGKPRVVDMSDVIATLDSDASQFATLLMKFPSETKDWRLWDDWDWQEWSDEVESALRFFDRKYDADCYIKEYPKVNWLEDELFPRTAHA